MRYGGDLSPKTNIIKSNQNREITLFVNRDKLGRSFWQSATNIHFIVVNEETPDNLYAQHGNVPFPDCYYKDDNNNNNNNNLFQTSKYNIHYVHSKN